MKTIKEIKQKLKELTLNKETELHVDTKVWISGRTSILEWVLR